TLLMIPGTDIAVSSVEQVVAAEVASTGVTVDVADIEAGTVAVDPGQVQVISDIDGDGVSDREDAFPTDAAEVADTDGDGIGNNADTDDDGDGTPDTEDAFPEDSQEVADSDGDGIGNVADSDDDNDGVNDDEDAFPQDATEVADLDGDGIGDNVDSDDDGDGLPDSEDAFPRDGNEVADTDGDGIGDNTDTDDDGDGTPDTEDALPLDNRVVNGISGTIGPDGGSLTSQDGDMTLTLPAGAVSADTVITIGQLTPEAYAAQFGEGANINATYVLAPEGLVLNTPATAEFDFSDIAAGIKRNRIGFSVVRSVTELISGTSFNSRTNKATVPLQTLGLTGTGYGAFSVDMEFPFAQVGKEWQAEYTAEFIVESGGSVTGFAYPDGYDKGVFAIQPVVDGAGIISQVAHESAAELDAANSILADTGTVTGNCDADGVEHLQFDMVVLDKIYTNSLGDSTLPVSGKFRVDTGVECRTSVAVTEPLLIEVGPGAQRMNALFRPPYQNISCSQQQYIIVSDNRTLLTSLDGQCQTPITTSPESNHFGALVIQNDVTSRIITHGEFGTTAGIIEDGAFVKTFGFSFDRPPATDLVYGMTTSGEIDPGVAWAVEGHEIYRYYLDGEEPIRELAFDMRQASGYTGGAFSFAATSPSTGVLATKSDNSEAWDVDIANGSAQKIADIDAGAINVRCAKLAEEVMACAVAAFDAAKVNILTGLPGAWQNGPAITDLTASSLTVRRNGDGNLIVAGMDHNDARMVLQEVTAPASPELPFGLGLRGEFFPTQYVSMHAQIGLSFSILPAGEDEQFPDGGFSAAFENTDGVGHILVIPAAALSSDISTVWFR
ncbi:MAG: thrombospondin type 3 repeat-containing protein, partial [Pseudomonadales bacterium]|nr:thrombospondin type 3 repeat-containing protein [Pseudomonadales bacterium]